MIIGFRHNLSKIDIDPKIKIGGETISTVIKTAKSLRIVIV